MSFGSDFRRRVRALLAVSATPRVPGQRALIVLAFIAFVSLGLPDTLLGVSWTAISARESFNRPISDVGFLLAFGTCGYLTSSFFGGAVLTRLGVGRLLVASCSFVTVALALYAVTPIWPGLFLAAFLGGIGAGAIDAGLNAFGARAFSPRVMNWMHGFWGVGATIGPLAMTAVIDRGLGWRTGYGGIAVVMVALTALFVATMHLWRRAPGGQSSGGEAHHAPSGVLEAMRQPVVQRQALFYFIYTGVEFGAGTWLLTLLIGRGADFAVAGTVVSSYWAALAVGRMTFGQAAAHFPPMAILRAALVGALVAGLLLLPAWPLAVTCFGAVLLGFSIAPLFPTVITLTPRRVGDRYASHSVAFQVSAAAVGIMVNPWLIGLAARWHSIEVLPYAVLFGTLLLVAINEIQGRRSHDERLPSIEAATAAA